MTLMAKEIGTVNVTLPDTRDIPSPRYADSTLRLDIHVVDYLLASHTDVCAHCLENTVEANAWVTLDSDNDTGQPQVIVECCLPCLIPVLDATPYLDDTQTITVEVHRSATHRPF